MLAVAEAGAAGDVVAFFSFVTEHWQFCLLHFLEFAIWGGWFVVLGNLLNARGFSRQDIGRIYGTMPIGSMSIDQYGFYGYKVDKIRKYYKEGKMVKKDRWKVRYAPVTEYVRTGINPNPNLPVPKKKKKKKKRLKAPGKTTYRVVQ